jgi:hypothetical protein
VKVFVGFDGKETTAWYVLAHSIITRATRPVELIPLSLKSLGHTYTRPRQPNEATEFSLTRFLVPYLSNYEGYSIFMDCDMLARCDIGDVLLYPLADPGKAVYVCQHDYVPKALRKMDGQEQTTYPRKNWSSFMVFDNARCKALTPEYVNSASGLDLHRFNWTTDAKIGTLPLSWNYLVGEDGQWSGEPRVLHYTNGMPWFPEYRDCEYAAEWFAEYDAMLAPMKAMKVLT